ncbi:MAG: winged helix-turn-helix domain-containing protein [Acidobacteriia bacterium]|nr:winged helix-turn-helix domain-containing protein [Terriglobia bacterium]
MNEEIGKLAGSIWHALAANGEMTLAKLKKEVGAEAPVFDWAIGWLAREDKIVLTREKRTTRACLKGWQGQTANAA